MKWRASDLSSACTSKHPQTGREMARHRLDRQEARPRPPKMPEVGSISHCIAEQVPVAPVRSLNSIAPTMRPVVRNAARWTVPSTVAAATTEIVTPLGGLSSSPASTAVPWTVPPVLAVRPPDIDMGDHANLERLAHVDVDAGCKRLRRSCDAGVDT